MSPHPELALFESWISGSLARPDQDAFEAHLHGCQSCTARLQEEARFEADLDEVAQAVEYARTAAAGKVLLEVAGETFQPA